MGARGLNIHFSAMPIPRMIDTYDNKTRNDYKKSHINENSSYIYAPGTRILKNFRGRSGGIPGSGGVLGLQGLGLQGLQGLNLIIR